MLLLVLWLWCAIDRGHTVWIGRSLDNSACKPCQYDLQLSLKAVLYHLLFDCRAFDPRATACRWKFQRTRSSLAAEGTQGMGLIS